MTPEQIKALAKQAGGTTHTTMGDRLMIFLPDALAEFTRLVRESVLSEARQAIEMANADRHIDLSDCVQIIEDLK